MVAAGLKWLSHILQEQRVPALAVTGSVMHRIPGLDLEEMWDLSLLTWSSLTRFDLPPDCFKRVLWTSSTAGFADSCWQRSLRAELYCQGCVSGSCVLLAMTCSRGEAMYLFRHLVVLTQYVGPLTRCMIAACGSPPSYPKNGGRRFLIG